MIKREKRVELLAPAGSFQSVVAAVNAGADAVYMGGRKFGARAYAESAKAEEEDMVMEAIRYCHLFSVKLYMTVNILFKDHELKELFSYIKPYYEAGVDGLIMQDLGAIRMIRRMFPDLEVHASTQQTIASVQGAMMAKKFGMTRAVCSRELNLREIRRIHEESGMELEVFCHGAMCYSYSGACFMSSLLGGRSGNRGRCAGTCRLCYEVAGKKGYYLSMKDMETVDLLPELIEVGAYSFKIEGRMKSPLYTAGVVSVYRKYLDRALQYLDDKAEGKEASYHVRKEDHEILREIYDRGGFTTYLDRHNGKEMIAIQEKTFREVNRAVTDVIEEKYIRKNKTIPVDAYLSLSLNQPAVLTLCESVVDGKTPVTVTAYSEEPVCAAETHPMTADDLDARMRKTGGTAFTFDHVEIQMEDSVFLPVGQLNQLRREALTLFAEEKLRGSSRTYREG
jgi:putative protease